MSQNESMFLVTAPFENQNIKEDLVLFTEMFGEPDYPEELEDDLSAIWWIWTERVKIYTPRRDYNGVKGVLYPLYKGNDYADGCAHDETLSGPELIKITEEFEMRFIGDFKVNLEELRVHSLHWYNGSDCPLKF